MALRLVDIKTPRAPMALLLALLIGCAPVNPAFNVPSEFVGDERSRMEAEPAPLRRPVVVLGGYRAPDFSARRFTDKLRRLTSGDEEDFLWVGYGSESNLRRAAATAVERIDQRWPSADPEWTTEVDVVGISMGGLVGRLAAAPRVEGDGLPAKRLRIARLFTLATPHRGARLAGAVTIDEASRAMQPGSPTLLWLDDTAGEETYEIIPYARLGDAMVGATNAAPPGEGSYWKPGPPIFSHLTIALDWPMILDIARRLRNEPPLAIETSEPPRD